jgi:hypothetical protein
MRRCLPSLDVIPAQAGIQSCFPKRAVDQLQLVDAGSEDAYSD